MECRIKEFCFFRYGSPHHNRSQSVKTPGRSSGRPNYLCLPQQRSRVASMPNTGVEEEYYRLRHFSITGKGIVNRGDSLKSRRSRSNNSVASSNSRWVKKIDQKNYWYFVVSCDGVFDSDISYKESWKEYHVYWKKLNSKNHYIRIREIKD